MKYRKLRIAWSVTWGMVAVLLCVLWVRSYWFYELVDNGVYRAGSGRGAVRIIYKGSVPPLPWLYHAEKLTEADEHQWPKHKSPLKWYHRPDYAAGWIAYWLMTVSALATCVLPWIGWSTRFSLRTLLIATTLVALLLGLFVWLR